MKKLITIIIVLSSLQASSQIGLISTIINLIPKSRATQIATTLNQGQPVTIQVAEIFERIKDRPRKEKRINRKRLKKIKIKELK